MQRTTILGLALTGLLAACATPEGGTSAASEARGQEPGSQPKDAAARRSGPGTGPDSAQVPKGLEPKPWTGEFLGRALVLADEITVQGPPGLLDHLALRSDDALFERVQEVTAEGLRITVEPRVPGELVRGQLDQWQLSAVRRIRMLEAPGATQVTLTALGEALWQDLDGNEQRADRLQWIGELQ